MITIVKFILVWSLGGILLCVMFFVITRIRQKYAERHKTWDLRRDVERRRLYQARSREFQEHVKYNLDHLPNGEPLQLAPHWDAVDRFIDLTSFRFWDEGDMFRYGGGQNYWDIHYIPKAEFDGDTLRLIELLDSDLKWFIANPTGITISEEQEVFEDFLRKKYAGLSEKSVKTICLVQLYR